MSVAYVLSTLRRRWSTVVLAVLIGALAGAAFAQAAPQRYSATATIVVTPVVSNPMTGNREDVNIRTEQEILRSREVARRAADTLGLPGDGSELRADVEVAAPLGSQILEVTMSADTPELAIDGANAIATAYLDLRRDVAAEVTERYLANVDQQIEDLLAEPPTTMTDGLIEQLTMQRSSVALTDPEPGRIIGAATPPPSASGPGLLTTVAGAAMAGFLLGIAAAVLRERLDPRVRSADRLELAAGPLTVVTGGQDEDAFWLRLADETIRRSQVDTASDPVRVLVHAAGGLPAREVAGEFRTAARQIFGAAGTELSWTAQDAEVEKIPSRAAGRVTIVPSGSYRASLAQAARVSDVAVVTATPNVSLEELTDVVSTLREHGLEIVVGLTHGVRPQRSEAQDAEPRTPGARRRTADAEQPQPEPAPVAG